MPEFDPQIQTEDIAFKESELVTCPKCARSNPPNRAECIYCGESLGVTAGTSARPSIRPMEEWELGFNVVAVGGDVGDFSAVAGYLGLESDVASAILGSGRPLPISRLETSEQAVAVGERLSQYGLQFEIVADTELILERSPVRLASIEVAGETIVFTPFSGGESLTVKLSDLQLIVTGLITNSRLESREKRNRRESKMVAETATVADEPMVDIYTADNAVGWRIHFSGFDFSFLGTRKSLVAADNLKRAVDRLCELSPQVVTDSDYKKLRSVLEAVWPTDTRRESLGMQRVGFGRKEFANTATTTNLAQFTKYSRLRRKFL